MFRRLLTLCVCIYFAIGSFATAETVQIRVERVVGGANRPALSPMWFGFHDGSFDFFDSGQVATEEVKAIAELGDADPLRAFFVGNGADAVVGDTPLTPDNPWAEATIDLDPAAHRHVRFAAMVLPSNDSFYGNDDPRQFEVFDSQGRFVPQDIWLTKRDWWDAGSEFNDKSPTGGGAYIMGSNPAEGLDSRGTITPFAELTFYNGAILPSGEVFETLPQDTEEFEPMVRITIVPEPSARAMWGGILLAWFGFIQRFNSSRVPKRDS